MNASDAYSYHPLPAFQDNYIWILTHKPSAYTLVVDPGTDAGVMAYLDEHHLHCHAILATHHHPDHVGGSKALQKRYRCPVYGSQRDAHRIPGITHTLKEHDTITLGPWNFRILEVDGHTLGHIAFYETALSWLFIGDTLFSLGCGRLFEGSALQMYNSLSKVLALDDSTLLFCGHEYTLQNTTFALHLEPKNPQLLAFFHHTEQQRQRDIPTLPSPLSIERQLNPFLRVHQHDFQKQLGFSPLHPPHKVLAWLRQQKDAF